MGPQGMARRRAAHRANFRALSTARRNQIRHPVKTEGRPMSLQIRRVVTGHDAEGRAKVEVDEIATNIISNRPGASSCVVWSTKGFPVDNDGFNDPTKSPFKTTVDNGTVFRVVRYEPGVSPRNHRTDSIDCAVVMSGAID